MTTNSDWNKNKNKMPARPLAPVRSSSLYTAEQEEAIEDGLLATPTCGYPSSSSSSSSSYIPLHALSQSHSQSHTHMHSPPQPNNSRWSLSPWSLMAAYRLYTSIPSKMRSSAPTLLSSPSSSSSVPFAVSVAAHFFAVSGRRVRIQQLLLAACVVLVCALILLATARPVCHHNSSSCVIIPDDTVEATAMPIHPTVLYYNTHGGCNQNMRGVMRSLGVKVDLFNPKQVAGYGMSASRARYLIESGHVDFVCSRYDIIVIGDTIPHGRALLESLLEKEPMKQCRSKIVVEMTNRFDWDVSDKAAYYNTISALVQLSKTTLKDKLFWVANNNVEKAFLEHKVGVSMPAVRVLRPLGVAPEYPYPLDLPEPNANMFAARQHYSTVYSVLKRKYDIPIAVFPFGHKYGGPKNLLRFKAFIDMPYEYSTMKLYENIAFGIPMIIPTPRFLEELYDTGVHKMLNPYILQNFPVSSDMLPFKHVPEFPAWSAYMDYYAPEFAPYLYYVDSYEQLRNMSSMSAAELDSKSVRVEGPLFYAKYREEILGGWLELFRDMGYAYKLNGDGGNTMMPSAQQQQPSLALPPQYDDDYNYGEARINWGPGVNGRPACNRPAPWCVIRKGWNDLGPGKKARLMAVYYNTHGGSERNLIRVFRHFNHKSLVLDVFNPDQISGYGTSGAHARAVINSGHVNFICGRYDLVILGDTIPHGRAILLSLLEDNPARRCQAARIVVEMTNRFDWDIKEGPDRGEFYRLMQKLVLLSRTLFKGRLVWVANNLADAKYFEFSLNMTIPEIRILRPLGISEAYAYPADLPSPDPTVLAAQWHKTNVYGYLREEENISMALIPFGHHYGGPHNLLQFKGFIDIPYQYSTMKLYENIAAGVPLLVPTPRFLMELWQEVQTYNLEWATYVDYYLPEFAPYIYYFDDYTELQTLSRATREKLDSKNVRVNGPKFYTEYRRDIYRGWEEVLLRGYPEE
ncbi:hypothetical protein HDU77_010282 [Chytriomyces hyalinus]|nr:hypothetical protein HDU77_010282 [Chytriomyces hyalinus]